MKNLYDISIQLLTNIKNENIGVDKVMFKHGDITEYNYDYNDTSMIFINCKTFSKDLMESIANKLKSMPEGVILITTSQTFNYFDNNWEIIDDLRRLMSWGIANIYIHKKIKLN